MVRYKRKTRPGLVALYNIWPGNGSGPFLQPRSLHGGCVVREIRVRVGRSTNRGQQVETARATCSRLFAMDWMSASNTAMSPIQTSMLLTTRPLRYRRMSHKCLHGRPQSFFQGRAKSEPRPEGRDGVRFLGRGLRTPPIS